MWLENSTKEHRGKKVTKFIGIETDVVEQATQVGLGDGNKNKWNNILK